MLSLTFTKTDNRIGIEAPKDFNIRRVTPDGVTIGMPREKEPTNGK